MDPLDVYCEKNIQSLKEHFANKSFQEKRLKFWENFYAKYENGSHIECENSSPIVKTKKNFAKHKNKYLSDDKMESITLEDVTSSSSSDKIEFKSSEDVRSFNSNDEIESKCSEDVTSSSSSDEIEFKSSEDVRSCNSSDEIESCWEDVTSSSSSVELESKSSEDVRSCNSSDDEVLVVTVCRQPHNSAYCSNTQTVESSNTMYNIEDPKPTIKTGKYNSIQSLSKTYVLTPKNHTKNKRRKNNSNIVSGKGKEDQPINVLTNLEDLETLRVKHLFEDKLKSNLNEMVYKRFCSKIEKNNADFMYWDKVVKDEMYKLTEVVSIQDIQIYMNLLSLSIVENCMPNPTYSM